MRLRTFTAATMDEAMRDMRRQLGASATVLMSNRIDESVRVLAADPSREPGANRTFFAALAAHGAPTPIIEAVRAHGGDPADALASCLPFAPLPAGPLLLIGPPGSGKSLTVAKLAARAVFARQPVALMTADNDRAAGAEELDRLATVLGLTLQRVGPATIRTAITELGPHVIIDTPAANPFDSSDIVRIAGLIAASRAEPVVVLPAGMDIAEATDAAHTFAALGAKRLITTRLDGARRWGSLFAAAAAGLAIGMAGVAPRVAHGIVELSPALLARALLDPNAIKPSETEES